MSFSLAVDLLQSEEPIRVAHVIGKMVGGGVESVVMNYYRHIDRNKVQFDFLVDEDSTLVPQEEIESLGGRVIVVPPYQNLLRYQKRLRQLFAEEQWPIVHSHINTLSVFPLRAAKQEGVPVRIAHSHSTAGKGETLRNIIKSILKTQSNRYPTHRMACSRYAGEWLFGKDIPFEFVPNAIELDRFVFNSEARKECREKLNLSDTDYVLGHIGRFNTQKNHSFLIKTFELLTKKVPKAVLLLVGDGPLRGEIESIANEMGLKKRVMFLGQQKNIELFYSTFDAFILPSLYEGMPVVALEAQASGLPCLLSNKITKEVKLTKNVQYLALSEGPAVWARTLEKMAHLDNRTVRVEDSLTLFDINICAHALEETYTYMNETA